MLVTERKVLPTGRSGEFLRNEKWSDIMDTSQSRIDRSPSRG